MLGGMADESPQRICCGAEMQPLAIAERSGRNGGVHRVTVYVCETCCRIDSLGESCDPWWVSAKARMLLELRHAHFRPLRRCRQEARNSAFTGLSCSGTDME